ncbi:hypothetical protein [Vibrio sp. F74]|uniref:hypothetical protein n=1 Tax=Vibrio sp. F74 TaxID=700020 RepID=UPI0035F5F5F6
MFLSIELKSAPARKPILSVTAITHDTEKLPPWSSNTQVSRLGIFDSRSTWLRQLQIAATFLEHQPIDIGHPSDRSVFGLHQ